MNKSRLMSTAAALLMFGVGSAYAQAPAPSKDQAPAQRAPAAQQQAPAEKTSPPLSAGEHAKPSTTGQSVQKEESGRRTTGQNLQKEESGRSRSGQTGASEGAKSGAQRETQKDTDVKGKGSADSKAAADSKAGVKSSSESHKADVKTDSKASRSADDNRHGTDKNAASSETRERSTSGQGAAAGTAKLTTEQRSKVTTIIKEKKVQPVNLDVSLSVGTRIPDHVHFYPLPTEVVTIYPEWRGYDYILVGEQIVIVDPATHEIVAILEA